MTKSNHNKLKIFVLTCREESKDFRFALARSLYDLGHEVIYIFLKLRPIVSSPPGIANREMSLGSLLVYLQAESKTSKNIVFFNSTNLVFPIFSAFMRLLFGGIWIFDVHDDLTYGRKGMPRLKARFSEEVLSRSSDIIVHAAPTLRERFPTALHFPNASDVQPILRKDLDRKKVLILTSIDRRFDFVFLEKVARLCYDFEFHIFGGFSWNDRLVNSYFDSMILEFPNLIYCGAYDNIEIPKILRGYNVTICPYCDPSELTYYIDPLRFYHCLNSGMEVISTPIPRAVDLQSHLHIARTAVEAAATLRGLEDGSISRKNASDFYLSNNWNTRAAELLSLLEAFSFAANEGK